MQVSDATLSQFSPSDLNTASSSVVQQFLSQLLTKVLIFSKTEVSIGNLTSQIMIILYQTLLRYTHMFVDLTVTSI